MPNFERSTDRFNRVIKNAWLLMGSGKSITVNHILAAFLLEGSSVGVHVWKNLDVQIENILSRLSTVTKVKDLEMLSDEGEQSADTNRKELANAPLDDDVQALLKLALVEAKEIGHNYCGTDHLAIAFFGIPETRSLLEEFGLTQELVRNGVYELLGMQEEDEAKDGIEISLTFPEFIDSEVVEDLLVDFFKAVDGMHRAAGGSGLQVDEGGTYLGTTSIAGVPQ